MIPISVPPASYGPMCEAGSGTNEGSVSYGFGAGPTNMDVFGSVIPIPMIVSGEEYGGKRPWFYTEL